MRKINTFIAVAALAALAIGCQATREPSHGFVGHAGGAFERDWSSSAFAQGGTSPALPDYPERLADPGPF